MSGYLLDTNIASHVIRGDRQEITQRLLALPISEIAISAVTEAELLYGLSRRNYPAALTERVKQFLLRVDILAWGREAAQVYADLRAGCETRGVNLAPFDMMIAAHAMAAGATLVSRERAFTHLSTQLEIVDWLI